MSRTTTNLTDGDKTRFLERGFCVVENAGHSLRLIKRDDAHQAISIKWEDLSALRELITLALGDGPMVIGLDVSSQSAQNAALAMRDKCVARVGTIMRERVKSSKPNHKDHEYDQAVAYVLMQLTEDLKSLTLDQQ